MLATTPYRICPDTALSTLYNLYYSCVMPPLQAERLRSDSDTRTHKSKSLLGNQYIPTVPQSTRHVDWISQVRHASVYVHPVSRGASSADLQHALTRVTSRIRSLRASL